ncbi:MAG: serine hydrolase domain-containing protein [Chakrabartia sp.]
MAMKSGIRPKFWKGAFSVALLAALGASAAPGPRPLDPLFAPGTEETRAALLIQNGKVIEKRYAPGYSDANRFISWSMAKSVTAVLIGELVADGKLQLDAPVPFAEWHGAGDPRAKITLRHMLNMASGLSHTEIGDPIYASDTNRILFVDGTGAMAAAAIAKPLEAAPGSKFEYSSMTSLLLSELITRQLTDSRDPKTRARAYRAFAAERLFRPAGITSAVLDFDGAGTQIGGSILYMSLEDWGRFGKVLLDGKGEAKAPIITADWLRFLRTPSQRDGGYGGQIWLNRPRPAGSDAALFPGQGPASLTSAIGHLGQYVIASPDQGVVLVRLGKTNDPDLGPVRTALAQIITAMPAKDSPNALP